MILSILQKSIAFLALLIVIGLGDIHTLQAQNNKKDKDATKKTIKELIKNSTKSEGLFTIYQDTLNGNLKMLLNQTHLNKEYIYFSQINDGIREVGTLRGIYGSSKIFKIEKYFDRIDFIEQNTSFYFDPNNPLSKAADANISNAVLASIPIEAANHKEGKYLIKMDALFLKEAFAQIKPAKQPNENPKAFKLGVLNKEKTKVRSVKNYPENTLVVSEYVYSNPSILNNGSRAVTDGRNVSIKVTHSLLRMPENSYKPRFDDPRVGYFATKVDNMTSLSAVHYRDLIHRWNLTKKNPNAEISEAVEPIVWWIENTTPIAFRESIKEGVLKWNDAFEKIGIKNALQVKIQPDNATWDAGDVRYNVLRWTSSPEPRFGGYGPSFVNPRTGQILGADIMLEFVHHTNRVKYDRLFSSEHVEETSLGYDHNADSHYCSYGYELQDNTLFGKTLLESRDDNMIDVEGLKKQAMVSLIMHEVGHTLGLSHNMKASHLYSPKQLNDENFIKGKAFIGSVMDYDLIHINRKIKKQTQYFSSELGPYDYWAIQCGYQTVDSKKELENIKARSTEPELLFGNDADDMRSSSIGIDPRVMVNDMSNDPITYSVERMELVNEMLADIKSKYKTKGKSYEELLQAYTILKRQYTNAGKVVSRYIGGIYVDRGLIAQPGSKQPYTPVPYELQHQAMEVLQKYVFAPEAFNTPNELYSHLAKQRRGYDFRIKTEDPKIHQEQLAYQKDILTHLLHPNTQQRLLDTEKYGNSYTLSEMMASLNTAIFSDDITEGTVNSFRQNLQLTYTKMLIDMVHTGATKKQNTYSHIAKSMALYNLTLIQEMTKSPSKDVLTQAHKIHLETLIKNTLEKIK